MTQPPRCNTQCIFIFPDKLLSPRLLQDVGWIVTDKLNTFLANLSLINSPINW